MHLCIQVFCYALSPSDGSEWRQRIEAEAEHFLDVSHRSVGEIAAQISVRPALRGPECSSISRGASIYLVNTVVSIMFRAQRCCGHNNLQSGEMHLNSNSNLNSRLWELSGCRRIRSTSPST